jgi:hypothetical protein
MTRIWVFLLESTSLGLLLVSILLIRAFFLTSIIFRFFFVELIKNLLLIKLLLSKDFDQRLRRIFCAYLATGVTAFKHRAQ